jgi:hypothetical protein
MIEDTQNLVILSSQQTDGDYIQMEFDAANMPHHLLVERFVNFLRAMGYSINQDAYTEFAQCVNGCCDKDTVAVESDPESYYDENVKPYVGEFGEIEKTIRFNNWKNKFLKRDDEN